MTADTAQDTENWEPLWTEKIERLKATISGLPVSDSGQEYDRADALDKLDDAQRLYISEHNPVDQALIIWEAHIGSWQHFLLYWRSSWILPPLLPGLSLMWQIGVKYWKNEENHIG